MVKVINGVSVPNIPFEERKEKTNFPIWRSSKNPIVGLNPVKGVHKIYNSAVLPYKDGFIGVFRGDTVTMMPYLYLGKSKDGINFEFEEKPINFVDEEGNPYILEYGYDPRLTKIEDKYYITWCDGLKGQPTIGLAETKDFKTFTFKGWPVLPYNRNGVLFPRKIKDEYILLTRPSDNANTPFGDIYISKSKDMIYWGKHKYVMGPNSNWEMTKVGAGPIPIETSVGWLLIYHGVRPTCAGFVYSIGGAILDKDDPSKVLYRAKPFIMTPEADYEVKGFVDNVIFPCSTLVDADTGRMAIYYGCADTTLGIAYSTIDEIVDYIIKNS